MADGERYPFGSFGNSLDIFIRFVEKEREETPGKQECRSKGAPACFFVFVCQYGRGRHKGRSGEGAFGSGGDGGKCL
ncbi:hypothetical protein F130042H8_13130 [Enterocloster alcoholdehydrogenati]|uniref:Uncharacterized protein n=1 Tax=Enterocloster alcoholdehydrogenati TaxID=2547410 RepID=A0ABQ0AW61_9FIRM